MALSRLDVINRALTEIAARQPISGVPPLYDGSAAAVAAQTVYDGAMLTLLRQQDWEFSRADAPLVTTGITPFSGWAYQYIYPTYCAKIRQVFPPNFSQTDPQPITWSVGFYELGGVYTKVINTGVSNARISYTHNTPSETIWDAGFTEQMVRYLGSILVMSVGGRPDFSREMLTQAGGVGQAGMDKDS